MRVIRRVIHITLICALLAAGMIASPVSAAGEVPVNINAPIEVVPGQSFTATVDIGPMENLDAWNFDVSFDPAKLQLNAITGGSIGGTPVPVDLWNEVTPGTFIIVSNFPGLGGVSGSGYLAELHFLVTGSPGDNVYVDLDNGTLSNTEAEEIAAVWNGCAINVVEEPPAQVRINSGDTILLSPGGSIEADETSGIPVDVTDLPDMGAPVNGMAAFSLEFNWNPAVITVDNILPSQTATNDGWNIIAGPVDNVAGTVTVAGFTTTYSTDTVTLLYIGITAAGSGGESSELGVNIKELIDKDNKVINAVPVNAPVNIVVATAEASISEAVSDQGLAVVRVNINRIVNPSDNTTVSLSGGLGSFEGQVILPDGGIEVLGVNGTSETGPVSWNPATGIFSVAVVASPMQPGNTTVAEIVVKLTGNNSSFHNLQMVFTSIRAAGEPGVNIPADGTHQLTFLRGDANEDGAIGIGDALFIAQYIVGQKTYEQIGPVNGACVSHDYAFGDKLGIGDALFIAQYIVGQKNTYYE